MKRIFITLTAMVATMLNMYAYAADYPYLTFETADGTKTSVSTESLSITLSGSVLTAGTTSFNLADLSKMYFSENDETAINEIEASEVADGAYRVYDLQGREVSRDQMKQGIYIIKGKNGNYKMNVK